MEDRYRNCYIGKEGVEKKHPLIFNEHTGRYMCSAFPGQIIMGMDTGGTSLTADEIDNLYCVYNKDGLIMS